MLRCRLAFALCVSFSLFTFIPSAAIAAPDSKIKPGSVTTSVIDSIANPTIWTHASSAEFGTGRIACAVVGNTLACGISGGKDLSPTTITKALTDYKLDRSADLEYFLAYGIDTRELAMVGRKDLMKYFKGMKKGKAPKKLNSLFQTNTTNWDKNVLLSSIVSKTVGKISPFDVPFAGVAIGRDSQGAAFLVLYDLDQNLMVLSERTGIDYTGQGRTIAQQFGVWDPSKRQGSIFTAKVE